MRDNIRKDYLQRTEDISKIIENLNELRKENIRIIELQNEAINSLEKRVNNLE